MFSRISSYSFGAGLSSSSPNAAARIRRAARKRILRAVAIESLESRRLLSVASINANDAVPFQHITVDPNPGTVPVMKILGDLTNSGKLDAIVGHETTLGGGGLDWYQYPASGNPNDPWIEHVIDPTADVYEAAAVADIAGHGANDIIVSERGQVVWYENPLGTGGNPATDPWVKHVIGSSPGVTHEMYLADIDGDGKMDVVTSDAIFFQNSPTSWTTVANPSFTRTEKGTAMYDSGSGNGAVDIAGTGDAPNFQVGWYENPRDTGGNARTDPWVFHAIGPAYSGYQVGDGISYATMDVNGDGRQDIVTAFGEGTTFLPGGLIWWEAPADPVNGVWTEHTIDASVQYVHNIRVADINGDGTPDLVVFEQDQSAQERLMVIYNEGGTGQNWLEQTLATTGGQNEWVGDIQGNGELDILNSRNGFFNEVNPIEVFMNQLSSDGIVKPVVTASPRPQTVTNGNSVTFSVAGTGTGPLTYQWQFNGLDIQGANSSNYTIGSVQAADDGDYRCIVGNPAGLIPSGAATLTVSNVPVTGAITGNLFNDLNGDGTKNGKDSGLSGRVLYLDLNNDGTLDQDDPTATTDANGNYAFNNVQPGSYTIGEVLPDGWKITTAGGSIPHVTVTSNQTTTVAAIGNIFVAISGNVFADANGNGTQDPGDIGAPGQHVWIDLNNDGKWESNEPTATTDSSGNYQFDSLSAGTYVVRLFVPAWMHQSSPVAGKVTVTSEPATGINFGIAQGGPVGGIDGIVFDDINGGQEVGEDPPLANEHVWLDLKNDGQYDAGDPVAITDATGNYSFANIPDGNYIVRVYAPPGSYQSEPAGGNAYDVTVSGQTVLHQNFGLAAGTVGIFGNVFDDLNNVGEFRPGDPTLAGQHLWIDLKNDGQYDPGDPTAVTGSNGDYAFTGLPNGTYVVRYFVPPGFHQTSPTDGAAQTVTLAGQPINNIVFGVAPGTVGGDAFQDTPAAVPGQIDADNFDDGGEGVGYYWQTTTNPGNGDYRLGTGVGIQTNTDGTSAGNGFNVAYATAGDWLNYTVNVASTRTYTLSLRVANPAAAGQMHLDVDGINVSGAIDVPNTGGWAQWQTITVPNIALSAGTHVLRLVFDANPFDGYAGNVNWLQLN